MTGYKWWQTAVFYQIYPRSFADGNGDGIGDFIGIEQKLDYLVELGVDALWLSPHFPSPQFDVGYDISDYTDVAPEYGTLEDFKRFLDGAHQRGLRVVLDLVLNHTSHLHQWFLESRSSRDNPRRDWYIWKDGNGGSPPNNWLSPFGGSAWEYDSTTDQYYYHYFLKEQPDLNWRNPQVKQAMWDAVRFWLDMGVDGYRLDAISTIYEDPSMPPQTTGIDADGVRRIFRRGYPADASKKDQMALWRQIFSHQQGQPGVHDLMQELRRLIDEYPDRVLVGETDDVSYYGDGTNELHLAFNFPLMKTTRLTPAWIRANQEYRLAALPPGAWPCNTLNNHDASRLFSRYGDGLHDEAIARVSLALMLTLRGTPFLYNGEEIGMTNYLLTDISQFRDPPAVWFYEGEIAEGKAPEEILPQAAEYSRDRCRTPMQWSSAPNAGFSPGDVSTWLPVNPNYTQGVNVASQLTDPASMLNFYKRLLRLRKQTPALVTGGYLPLHTGAESYLAFLRQTTDQCCLVVLSYSDQPQTLSFDFAPQGRCIYSNFDRQAQVDLAQFELAPYEIVIALY